MNTTTKILIAFLVVAAGMLCLRFDRTSTLSGKTAAPSTAAHPASVLQAPAFAVAPPNQKAVAAEVPSDLHAGALLDQAPVLETRATAPGQDGRFVHSRLVETDMKYPYIRIDETRMRDPATGRETVLSRSAQVADHIIIKLKPGVGEAELAAINQRFGAQIRRKLLAPQTYLVALQSHSLDAVASSIAAYRQETEAVAYSEPDYVVNTVETLPNDPSFDQLYGLHNTGQTGGTPDADIDAPEAWDVTQGSREILVAIIDTGVDFNHPDLAANIWSNPGETGTDASGHDKRTNGMDDDGNGFIDDHRGWDFYQDDNQPFDDHSHGTHCAGTIGALGHNGLGVAGVCWRVSIVGLKFLSAGGSGYTSDAVDAIYYGTLMGIDLSSNSWGGGGYSEALRAAIADAHNHGILFVAAAGNWGANSDVSPMYPAAYDCSNIISVAATDQNDDKAYFSNYGLKTVDLGAPGVNILSTLPGNSYGSKSGTSMATPHVSGALALAWGFNPGLAHTYVAEALLASVDPIPALAGKTVTGGRLNIAAMLSRLGVRVQGSTPAANQVVFSPPTDFVITLSAAYDPATVAASDLAINGTPADGFTMTGPDTITFHYLASPCATQGLQSMFIALDALGRLGGGQGVQAWSNQFRYDALALQVSATDPADGSMASLPLASIQITLNEPCDPDSIGINDLVLNQGRVAGCRTVAVDTVEYLLADVVAEGTLQLAIPAGALTDVFGNPSLAYAGSVELDAATMPYPAALQRCNPPGSLVYQAVFSALISNPGDVDHFTIALDAGQTLAVVAEPAAGLPLALEVRDPAGAYLGGGASPWPGAAAVAPASQAQSAGLYTVAVSAHSNQVGAYELKLILNAEPEAEAHDGPANDTWNSAQNLDGSKLALLGQASRSAVLGLLESTNVDWYAFSVAATETVSLAATPLATGSASLDLYDSTGTLLAEGSGGASNVSEWIDGASLTTPGTYFARLAGSGAYSLIVIQGGHFDLESNDSQATAKSLSASAVALGWAGTGDFYHYNAQAGDHLKIETRTPADGTFDFPNLLDPAIELYHPGGALVAMDDNSAPDGRNASLVYTAAVDGAYALRVRAAAGDGEYVVGLNVKPLRLLLPAQGLEGQVITGQVVVMVSEVLTEDLQVALASTDSSEAVVPPFATIPAGELSAAFVLTLPDDGQLDGTHVARITASATGYADGQADLAVLDASSGALGVWVPLSASEGAGPLIGQGTVTVAGVVGDQVTVALSSDDPSEIRVPPSVIILAGQSSAVFDLAPVEDSIIDGAQVARITAHVDNWVDAETSITILDNEHTNLLITVPSVATEGDGELPRAGFVRLSGTLLANLEITLATDDASEATVSPHVTILAGQSAATFQIAIADDDEQDGAQAVTVTAQAAGFAGGTQSLLVADNELHHFAWQAIPSPQTRGVDFGAGLEAFAMDGRRITNFTGTAALSGAGADGAVSITPVATTPFAGGAWSGMVHVATVSSNVVLSAAAGGSLGLSNPFDIQGAVLRITPGDFSNTLVEAGALLQRNLLIENLGNRDLSFELFCWPGGFPAWTNTHPFTGYLECPRDVHAVDLNQDGHMDVVSANNFGDSRIAWWRNNDGSGTNWTRFNASPSRGIDGYRFVATADLDSDGDLDLASTANGTDEVAWHENVDGSGTSWITHVLATNFDYAWSVHTDDLDRDGDMDILATAGWGDQVAWWENNGGKGTNWIRRTIDPFYDWARWVHSGDMDGDGDCDVVGAAYLAQDITWWENLNGKGTSWSKHTIAGDLYGADEAHAVDMEKDGDLDVLVLSGNGKKLLWYENINSNASAWVEHLIFYEDLSYPARVYAEDVDQDGDNDVISCSAVTVSGYPDKDGWLAVWENTDGSCTSWVQHVIRDSGTVEGVAVADINHDRRLDLVCAFNGGDHIDWLENAPASSVFNWLRADARGGALGAAAQTNIAITFDAGGYQAGARAVGHLLIICNDATAPTNVAPAVMVVVPPPPAMAALASVTLGESNQVAWAEVTNASAYIIECVFESIMETGQVHSFSIRLSDANQFTFSNLVDGVMYSYRIQAIATNEQGELPGAWSDWQVSRQLSPTGDWDNDGIDNATEVAVGTGPTDQGSDLSFSGCAWDGRNVNVNWRGGTGIVQYIEYSAGLEAADWICIHTNLPPMPITNSLPWEALGEFGFYRFKVAP